MTDDIDAMYADDERRRGKQRADILEVLWGAFDCEYLDDEPTDEMAENVLQSLEAAAEQSPQSMGWVDSQGRP